MIPFERIAAKGRCDSPIPLSAAEPNSVSEAVPWAEDAHVWCPEVRAATLGFCQVLCVSAR